MTDGMKYEKSGSKHGTSKQIAMQAAATVGTPSLLWLLVKRHKVAILAVGNVLLVLNWALPEWHSMVMSLFN